MRITFVTLLICNVVTTREQLIGLLIICAAQGLYLKIVVGNTETKYSILQVGFEKSQIIF